MRKIFIYIISVFILLIISFGAGYLCGSRHVDPDRETLEKQQRDIKSLAADNDRLVNIVRNDSRTIDSLRSDIDILRGDNSKLDGINRGLISEQRRSSEYIEQLERYICQLTSNQRELNRIIEEINSQKGFDLDG